RLATLEADILQKLRQRLEHIGEFAHRAATCFEHGENLKRGNETIARCRKILEHNMAGLLTGPIVAMRPHMLDDIAIAYLRANEIKAERPEIALKAEIGHDRGDDTRRRERAHFLPMRRNETHDLVAIDNLAALIGNDHAVCV